MYIKTDKMSFKNIINKTKKGIATALASIILSLPVISNADIRSDNHFKEKTEFASQNNINLKNKFDNYKKEFKPEISIPEIAANTAIGYFLTVYFHELGHAAVAKSYGFDDISVKFDINRNAVAYTHYNGDYANLSKDQKALFDLGGILSTRLNYELINYLMGNDKVPEKLEPFMSTLALISRLDMPFRIFSDSGNYFFGDNNIKSRDIGQCVNRYAKSKSDKDLIYGLLIGAEFIDLYLDRKEIKNHFNRALGKEVDFSKDEKNLDFDVIYTGDKLGLSLTYKF